MNILNSFKKAFRRSSAESDALVLQTISRQPLGFTLFSPSIRSEEGDCVFVVTAESKELPNSRELAELEHMQKAGEHKWARQNNEIVVSFNGINVLCYKDNGVVQHLPSRSKLGVWSTAHD